MVVMTKTPGNLCRNDSEIRRVKRRLGRKVMLLSLDWRGAAEKTVLNAMICLCPWPPTRSSFSGHPQAHSHVYLSRCAAGSPSSQVESVYAACTTLTLGLVGGIMWSRRWNERSPEGVPLSLALRA